MKNFLIFLYLIPLASNCQFRDNFLSIYTGQVDVYDIGHFMGTDKVFVNASTTDSVSIVITDTIPWLNFEYILYPDSTFANYWLPTQDYGYFYSNGDSIYIYDEYNSPYYREWHCGRLGAVINESPNSPFSIYPNPVKEKIFICSKQSAQYLHVKLFNPLGESVLEISIYSIQSKTEINLPFLPDGIYFIIIETENNSFSQKIIIRN